MNSITIRFIKSPTGRYNLAYSAGNVVAFEEKQAREMIESGYAVEHQPGKPGDDPVDLPGDIPGRANLVKSGVTTMAELAKYKDFKDIPGIGRSLAARLAAYMSK
jgi:hypothetical protein